MGAGGNIWEQLVQFDVAGRGWVRLGVVGMEGRRGKRTTQQLYVCHFGCFCSSRKLMGVRWSCRGRMEGVTQ